MCRLIRLSRTCKTGICCTSRVAWTKLNGCRLPDAYFLIPVAFSLYSLGVRSVWLLKIELKVVFELKPES